MKLLKPLALIGLFTIIPSGISASGHEKATSNLLWYNRPAPLTGICKGKVPDYGDRPNVQGNPWEAEALPIGNGRLGAMVFGGVSRERLALNENSFWSGGEVSTSAYNYGPESGNDQFGSYQPFCDLLVDFSYPGPSGDITDYSRSLSLEEGTSKVRYNKGGITYTREVFASYPDQVIVMRCTASKLGSVNASFRLKPNHTSTIDSSTVSKFLHGAGSLTMEGRLKNELQFGATLLIIPHGGMLTSTPGERNINVTYQHNEPVLNMESLPALSLSGADGFTLIISLATDYRMEAGNKWKNETKPGELNGNILKKASRFNAGQLRERHQRDYKSLYDRCRIDLGKTDPSVSALPTNERLEAYRKKPNDPELEETLFQYGRYMIIASSRPGSLPANLQGLWNDKVAPAWASDYHSNINLQMNYWGVEPANLPECHLPLIDMLKAMAPAYQKATRSEFKTANGKPARGWTVRTSQNIFGGTSWEWNIPGSAWYAHHLWEHYTFNGDSDYLRETAYPMMKDVCMFWEDHLKTLGQDGAGFHSSQPFDPGQLKGIPQGTLVAPNGWSPEHGPREDGVSHDQQLIWELFDNTITAARILNTDQEWATRLSQKRDRLAGPKIGKEGNLQEWMIDRIPKTDHRHTSHLYAVYPGTQISLEKTPKLAGAAQLSLEWRGTSGDSRRSWTWPWRAALWARFKDGEKAHDMIQGMLQYNMLPNMLATHPPMQMDGTLGITGAIAEMLVQSHAGEISLLPALPPDWFTGSATGLKARGNLTIDMKWEKGKITWYRLRSPSPRQVMLRVNGYLKHVTTNGSSD